VTAKAPAPPGRAATRSVAEIRSIAALLEDQYREARIELQHDNAYQLLVATILSAQSTDKLINTVTPALFATYPDATTLARADQADLETMIHSTGFFRMKAKHLLEMARAVVERHGGEIPDTMAALVELPGVARKTANVVLGCAFGKSEGIIVDTHVTRVSARLGLTEHTDPVKIEQDLMGLFPRTEWTKLGTRMILHGRRVCRAQDPDHDHCILAPVCPSATLVVVSTKPKAKPAPKAASAAKAKAKAKPKAKAKAKKRR
jgi:endonuclease-3